MIAEPSGELAALDSCTRAIVEAEHFNQLTDLRSRAEAIRVWAKSANQSLEVQNRAAELRLAAERKAGKMLSQMGLKGGDRKSNGHADRLKLTDLGITQNQSKRWQKEAAIPEKQFTDRTSTLLGKEVTGPGLLRLAVSFSPKQNGGNQMCQLKGKRSATVPQYCNVAESTDRGQDPIADLQEEINLLQKVLTPFASDVESLSKSERRVAIYLL